MCENIGERSTHSYGRSQDQQTVQRLHACVQPHSKARPDDRTARKIPCATPTLMVTSIFTVSVTWFLLAVNDAATL